MSVPYFIMLGFDLRGKRKSQKIKALTRETNDFPEDTFLVEEDFNEEEKIQEPELVYSH
ncbi:MAG: hypothetical protein P8X91_07625 [Candidatus Bathyarchaeota archaeon]